MHVGVCPRIVLRTLGKVQKLQPGGKTCKYKTTPQIRCSTSSPKTMVAKPPFPGDDQETNCHYLELLVLLPQPLDFALQPLTLFHHLLNFSVIQGGTQSFRHRWCFCLWCIVGIILFISTSCCSEINESPSVTNHVLKDFFMQSKVVLSRHHPR